MINPRVIYTSGVLMQSKANENHGVFLKLPGALEELISRRQTLAFDFMASIKWLPRE